jgi:hypothetical protein
MITMTEFTCIAPLDHETHRGGVGNDVYMNTQAADENGFQSRSPLRIIGEKNSTVAFLRLDPNRRKGRTCSN